jgi:hypothetical protein
MSIYTQYNRPIHQLHTLDVVSPERFKEERRQRQTEMGMLLCESSVQRVGAAVGCGLGRGDGFGVLASRGGLRIRSRIACRRK